MRSNRIDSLQRLQHIRKAIEDIQKYTADETLDSFNEQSILQDAVLMQFMIIGEAIAHVEQDTLDRYEYPWYKVRSFRSMIAHEYFNIKMTAVWQIIEKDLESLRSVIDKMLLQE